jgi:hypothetical protein
MFSAGCKYRCCGVNKLAGEVRVEISEILISWVKFFHFLEDNYTVSEWSVRGLEARL